MSSASVRSISFLSFIVPIFALNVPLVSVIFLKSSEWLTGRKARGPQVEEIDCKWQRFFFS